MFYSLRIFQSSILTLAIAGLCALSGCTAEQTIAGAVVATATASHAPAHELEQIYYLGVFDPREQVPPTVYRVTVHGQASFTSFTKFATGWAPAAFVDTLNSNISFNFPKEGKEGKEGEGQSSNPDGGLVFTKGTTNSGSIQTGRRLVVFGPEGFRVSPKDQRLVMVMGNSPEAFFEALGETVEEVGNIQIQASEQRRNQQNAAANKLLDEELIRVRAEKTRLNSLEKDVNRGVKLSEGN